uniref:Isopentenyl phosphate kinase n=1 Tax=Pogona vitticeps TaxID=103695 RepID=A0A6J0STL8_9SAUR
MAGVDCILKLGGSALTQKDQLETLKGASLRKAAAIVAQLRGAGEKRCIVVHGAGSFGHFQAKEHDVCSGTSKESAASESLRRGLCLTRLSVTKLNHLVTEEFVSCGIPAVGISPFGTWKTACKGVSQPGIDAVKDVLEAGYVPVLHGDCVLDSERHCCILSGDTIVEVLAMKFSPKRVIFLTDVSGIYSCPPGTAGARLVDFITVRPDGTMDPAVLTSVRPHDTTGGVSLKLQTAVNIVSHSRGAIPVLICKLDSEAAEKACLTGELKEDEGTKFSFIEA